MKEFDEDLPEEYQPRVLRPSRPEPRRETAFACGHGCHPKYSCMFAGPFPSLDEALEVVPEDASNVFVFRFNEDGTDDVLYNWDRYKRTWCRWRPGR